MFSIQDLCNLLNTNIYVIQTYTDKNDNQLKIYKPDDSISVEDHIYLSFSEFRETKYKTLIPLRNPHADIWKSRAEIEESFTSSNRKYKKHKKLFKIENFIGYLNNNKSLPFLKLFIYYIDQCSMDKLISINNLDFCSFEKFSNVSECLLYLDQVFNNIDIQSYYNILDHNTKSVKNLRL